VDQFKHIHDFARAYGSLCWNLSKVIPRKDLPRIYTMYLPPEALGKASGHMAQASSADAAASSLSHALAELSGSRDEVLHAVRGAPERRVDNLVTRTHDATATLRMHAVVLEEARRAYVALRLRYLVLSSALLSSGPLAAYYTWHVTASMPHTAAAAAAAAVALVASGVRARVSLSSTHTQLTSASGLDAIFEKLHMTEVGERDEFVLSLWRRVKPQLQSALATIDLAASPALTPTELTSLDQILQQTIPDLRRLTSAHAPVAATAAAAAAQRATGKAPRLTPPDTQSRSPQ